MTKMAPQSFVLSPSVIYFNNAKKTLLFHDGQCIWLYTYIRCVYTDGFRTVSTTADIYTQQFRLIPDISNIPTKFINRRVHVEYILISTSHLHVSVCIHYKHTPRNVYTATDWLVCLSTFTYIMQRNSQYIHVVTTGEGKAYLRIVEFHSLMRVGSR
jgi:hypothetical protein